MFLFYQTLFSLPPPTSRIVCLMSAATVHMSFTRLFVFSNWNKHTNKEFPCKKGQHSLCVCVGVGGGGVKNQSVSFAYFFVDRNIHFTIMNVHLTNKYKRNSVHQVLYRKCSYQTERNQNVLSTVNSPLVPTSNC